GRASHPEARGDAKGFPAGKGCGRPALPKGAPMSRNLLFLCGLAACAGPLPEAAAQKPLAPSGAFNLLTVEQQVLLARRDDLLKDLARYQDKVRNYTTRHQRTTRAIAELSLPHGPWGRWTQDQRAQRLAQLRHETDS